MIDTKEIYWAAGFYEGEGSCRCRPNAGFEVTAVQCNLEPLLRLQKLFGGQITEDDARRYNPNASQRFVWRLNGNRALGVIQTMYCLLSEKRKQQAKTAIDFQKTRAVRRWAKAPHPDYKNWLYENDQEFREKTKARVNAKYASDETFREQKKEYIRQYRERLKQDVEKMAKVREQRNQRQRERRAKLKAMRGG